MASTPTRQRPRSTQRPRPLFGGDDMASAFLPPILARKRRAPRSTPSWADVARLVRSYTDRNGLLLPLLDSLDDERLKEVFDRANQHLKDWKELALDVNDPLVKRTMAEHIESVSRIKMRARGILERDLRAAIARSAVERLPA